MLVSVLMSVYNAEIYLEKAIKSILTQTFTEFEFIVIDDGSTDRSVEICKRFAAEDTRIVFMQNRTNMGLAAALNKGITIAKGTYIARQDADDCSAINRLEVQLKYALDNQDTDLIGSNSFVIDINDNIVYEDRSYASIKDFKNALLNRKAIFPHGSAFLKKEKLIDVGLYDARFYYVQDGEFWLRLISEGAKVHVINKPLYFYRTAPVASTKSLHAKDLFNKVLRMKYAENKNADVVDLELEHIKTFLQKTKAQQRPNYMADYWKSLGNASYLNHCDTTVSYNYIKKAIFERNSLVNYPKYVMIALMYMLPLTITKQIIKLGRIA
ncbi:glycosyltransferase [Pedobacter sp. B4-66]|uniref:glycosyltransferase n=1 Tax=Pedobacter sp. B4-66 TaxID=2817280 RepID=UPI001BD94DD4|nr:glycosyltransferase [Pedobacter sp. B4-66]